MTRAPSPADGRLLRRFGLALWFGFIAAFGLLRFFMRAFRHGTFDADAVSWMWLAGGCVVGIFAMLSLLFALKRR